MQNMTEQPFKNLFLKEIQKTLKCERIEAADLKNDRDIYLEDEDDAKNVITVTFIDTLPYTFLIRHSKKWKKSRIDINKLIVLGIKEGLDYIDKNDEEIRSPDIWLCIRCLDIVKRELKKNFVSKVRDIIHPTQFSGTALFSFIKRNAQKWHCIYDHKVIYEDVLVEAVRRGIAFIEDTGEEIHSPKTWLRGTSLNILRDMVKENIREEDKVTQMSLLLSLRNKDSNRLELAEQLKYLRLAMKELPPKDRHLIEMRFFKNKSYEEIQKLYLDTDGKEIKIPALRKRECRAIKRLKDKFFSLYGGDLIT